MTDAPTDKKLSEPKRSAELAFEDGALCINLSGYGDKDGAGHIAFNDDALEYEPHEEDNGTTRWQRLPKSELIAIRDFLIKHFPTAESRPSAIREAVEGEREACAKIAEGDLFEVRYRSWPHWNPGGNLSRERDVTQLAEATAAAIRARGEEKENG